MAFISRVEKTISAAHHNGPEDNKCHNIHGHDFRVVVQYTYDQLDEYGWGPDFGGIKKIIEKYDHGVGPIDGLGNRLPNFTLNKWLAPDPPSAEHLARRIYQELADWFNLAPDFVRVHEGSGNSVSYNPNWNKR